MIKEINFSEGNIEIKEEKKGLFGFKTKTINISISSINQIERQIMDQELICITINYGNFELYFIEKEKCEEDLRQVYENIINIRKENLFEVVETDLTTGSPEITVLMEKNT